MDTEQSKKNAFQCEIDDQLNAVQLLFSRGTYRAVPDVQEDLLCLLWPADDVRETRCFL